MPARPGLRRGPAPESLQEGGQQHPQSWGRYRAREGHVEESRVGVLHSSQRETHTRPVVRRAVTPEDASPDPQSRGACGSPHPAEGALRM